MSIKSSKITPQNLQEAKEILSEVGCSKEGVEILARKMVPLNIKLSELAVGSVNILKQEALAIGIDVATHKLSVVGKIEKSDVIIIGNLEKILQLLRKLELQKGYLSFDKIISQIKLCL